MGRVAPLGRLIKRCLNCHLFIRSIGEGFVSVSLEIAIVFVVTKAIYIGLNHS